MPSITLVKALSSSTWREKCVICPFYKQAIVSAVVFCGNHRKILLLQNMLAFQKQQHQLKLCNTIIAISRISIKNGLNMFLLVLTYSGQVIFLWYIQGVRRMRVLGQILDPPPPINFSLINNTLENLSVERNWGKSSHIENFFQKWQKKLKHW